MSVVEGLRNIGKLNVQTKGYDFASYTHHICSNEKVFLKRYRWCSTMKIIEVTNEIVVNIDLANAIDCRSKKQEKINERLKFQNLALVKTIELESLMEIAYRDNNQESRHIDDDKMNYWVGLPRVVKSQKEYCLVISKLKEERLRNYIKEFWKAK